MSLCLYDLSALACLRHGLGDRSEGVNYTTYGQDVYGWPEGMPRALAQRLAACGVPAPCEGSELHLMVDGKGRENIGGPWVVAHAWPGRLPKGSIVDAGHAIATSSAEFVFLQLAQRVDTIDLVRLGLELCGRYRMGVPSQSDIFPQAGAQMGGEPLTTAAQLRGYLARSPEVPGIVDARKAATLVADGMMSAHAAALYLLLCLPKDLGGYGLPLPRPGVITLSSQRNTRTRGDHLVSELFWPKARVGLECATAEVPPTAEFARMAREREDSLMRGEARTIVLSASDIADLATMHAVARQLARRLGVRMPLLNRRFRVARKTLRSRIVPTVIVSARAAWAA